MQKSTEDSKGQHPYFAKKDGAEQNAIWSPTYSDAERAAVEELYQRVDNAYFRSCGRIRINFRKGFMNVAVNKPARADRSAHAVIALDKWASERGFEKRSTGANNINYRIARFETTAPKTEA